MIIGSQPRRNLALVTAIALLSLLPATSALPQDMQNSFVEFNNGQSTTTYDLRTVEVIQPGKFVIPVRTVIDDPDVMRFRLKLLATLQSHCARQEGSYPAPAEVFTLGPPDMPVEEIEVETPLSSSWQLQNCVLAAAVYQDDGRQGSGFRLHSGALIHQTTRKNIVRAATSFLMG